MIERGNTRGRRIEGVAIVRCTTTVLCGGAAGYTPLISFDIEGETYSWLTDKEALLGLRAGDRLAIHAFARLNGRLYRVRIAAFSGDDRVEGIVLRSEMQ